MRRESGKRRDGRELLRQKLNYLKIFKIAAGVVISVALAETAGLNFATSAGIITLLSIQDTKKETIRIVARRLVSFWVALFLFAVSTRILGYTPWALGAFLLLFSPVCMTFGLSAGISTNTVLMCHFLGQRAMEPEQILNEFLLLILGTGVGIVLNLYMPRRTEAIRGLQAEIEERMRLLLRQMAKRLGTPGADGDAESCAGDLERLRQLLERGQKHAYENMENHLLADVRYYFRYMSLRRTQLLVLERIDGCLGRLREMDAAWAATGEREPGERDLRGGGLGKSGIGAEKNRDGAERRGTGLEKNRDGAERIGARSEKNGPGLEKDRNGVEKSGTGAEENRFGTAGAGENVSCCAVQSARIAGFLFHTGERLHEYNNVVGLLEDLESVKAEMRRDPMPRGREEFEYRAVLFQILTELEQFLLLKREFVRRLSQEDLETFWLGA